MSGLSFEPPNSEHSESSPGPGPDPAGARRSDEPVNGHNVRHGRFQFSLRTLLLVTTGVSVLVSLVAWLGVVFFMITMTLTGVVTVFVGTYILDNRVILAGGIMMLVSSVLSPFMFVFAGKMGRAVEGKKPSRFKSKFGLFKRF